LPKAPKSIAAWVRAVVAFLFALAALLALGFARVQRGFAPSAFEFGKVRTIEGVIELNPFPTLVVSKPPSDGGGSSRYLLVAAGKHGADSQVEAFAGMQVRLRGTLIYRGNQTMIELVSGSISTTGNTRWAPATARDLGAFELTGEIVDSKCYFGVMNPGNGKVHRDCAVRCLSGGIPPLFATNDFHGSPAVFLLEDASQKPLPRKALLDRIAQPVRIRGKVLQIGGALALETEPSAILPLT